MQFKVLAYRFSICHFGNVLNNCIKFAKIRDIGYYSIIGPDLSAIGEGLVAFILFLSIW